MATEDLSDEQMYQIYRSKHLHYKDMANRMRSVIDAKEDTDTVAKVRSDAEIEPPLDIVRGGE